MANRYEVIKKSTGKVIMPKSGNVSLQNFFEQEGEDWTVEDKSNWYIDSECNKVHIYYVEERIYN